MTSRTPRRRFSSVSSCSRELTEIVASSIAFPFFSTTGALMGSMTYWSVPFFWVSVAVIVSCFQYSRRPVTRLNKMIRDMLEIRAKRKKKPKQNAESVSQDL